MSVLIAMAVYSTEENKKDECLEKTLASLQRTVDYKKHKIRLSVNAYTDKTKEIIERYTELGVIDFVFYNPSNLGTAEAINKIWNMRDKGQHCIKMDDDIVIESSGWVDILVECLERNPNIGQIGLKRVDCSETTWHPDPFHRSELIMLPHEPGQRWLSVDKVHHVMGSCVLHNSALLDKVGFLRQFGQYGFDDCIMSYRSMISGFINCHYPHILIHHIDEGKTEFQTWKEKFSASKFPEFYALVDRLLSKEESCYYNPFEK
jgi:GT2 family glycosyltransferase